MRAFLIVCVVAACGGSRLGGGTQETSHPFVEGTIRIDSKLDPALPRAGTLALYWMTKAEYDLAMSGSRDLGPFVTMLRTLTVVGPVDLSKPTPYRLPVERGDIVVSAVLDSHHALVGSLLARDGFGNVMGDSKPVHVDARGSTDIVLDQVVQANPPTEACTGPRHELVTIDAPETAGSSGNATQRRACVILPPSYAAGDRRYPVVYFFPGWGETDSEALATFGYDKIFDARIQKTGKEAILVVVATRTKLGSSYLVDSPVQGAWDHFLTNRLVPEIDRRYRTHATPRGRATAGHSTGGFGAVSIGFRHPEVFGVVTTSAPDGMDVIRWLFGSDTSWALPLLRAEDASGGPGFFASYAADWSPDASPRGFAWPVDPATGRLRDDIAAKWRVQSPAVWLTDPARADALRTAFSGRVCVVSGSRDEFGLGEQARWFHEQLTRARIESALVMPDTGHMDAEAIVGAAFEFALKTLE